MGLQKSFSYDAQRLLSVDAQIEARRFFSEQIFPEHIILALLKNKECAAYSLLRKLKLDVFSLQIEAEKAASVSSAARGGAEVPFAPRTNELLKTALRESDLTNHPCIGTAHILCAIMGEKNSAANAWLLKNGETVDSMRNEIRSAEPEAFAAPDGSAQRRRGKNVSALADYSRDITEAARAGKIDPVIGRNNEIERLM